MTILNKNLTIKKNIITKINSVLEAKSKENGFKSVSFYDFSKIANFNRADNIVCGDIIGWIEPVFTGSFRNAKFSHFEFFYGKIAKESYGAEKAQHTFTIETQNGNIRRKGRTLFKEVCLLLSPATNREALQKEKNERGNASKKISLQKWIAENDVSHPRYEEKISKLEKL